MTKPENKVQIRQTKADPIARCLDCDRIQPNASRERVRGHVRRLGHRASFTVPHVTWYAPPTGGETT